MNRINILYLYAEIHSYQVAVFRELIQRYQAELHIVHRDRNLTKPYQIPEMEHVRFYPKSRMGTAEILALAAHLEPTLVYVSGWMDEDYLKAAKRMRQKGIPVVAGSDTQWKGTFRHYVASLTARFSFRNCFSHIWVAGPYQYEYARRLGFCPEQILFNTLSADVGLFSHGVNFLEEKAAQYPRTFLYVGNFRKVKGTDILASAFREYRMKYRGDWQLCCIGSGDIRHELENQEGIEVHSFLPQEQLLPFIRRSGAFILPSRYDQWGVVVHEFAAAGMPMLVTNRVGAHTTFLINRFNGYLVKAGDPSDLADKMDLLARTAASELIEMGRRSSMLASRITPEMTAASLMSIISR